MRNPYDVLGLSKDASAEDIKRVYRQKSKEWHPDKHKGDKAAEEKFKEINEAYSILSDPKKRSQYDQFGSTGQGGGFGGGGFDFSGFGQGGMPDLEDLFGSFFGGNGRRQKAARRGEDLQTEVEVTLQEIVTNVERTVRVRRMAACDTCRGSGSAEGSEMTTCDTCGGTGNVTRRESSFFGVIEQRAPCDTCGGSGKVPKVPCKTCRGDGRVERSDTLTFSVPAGVHDGQVLRVSGQGGAGRRGEPAGDLYVAIRVQNDSRFVRDGDDIHTTLQLHVLQAILGDVADVETLHGVVQLKIPEGTQPGQVLRIKGKGLPSLQTGRVGSHDVHIEVMIPTKLSKTERKLLEEWRTQTR